MASAKMRTAVRFAVVEGVYYAIFATFASFVAAFCLARGYSQALVSVLVAVYMLCSFAGQFLWGSMCDRFRTNKKIFLLGVAAGGVIQLVMLFTQNRLLFAVAYGMFGLMLGPMGSILDTWMLRSIHYDVALYGKARSAGTAGYAVCILFMGALIARFGYGLAVVLSTVCVAATVLLALRIPDAPVLGARTPVKLKNILSILKNPMYLLLILVLFLIGLAVGPANNLKIMVLQSVGGDVSLQGVDNFIGCVAQFFLFFFSGLFDRFPAKLRLLGSSGIILAALALYWLASGPWMIYAGTFLLFGSYSVLTASSRLVVKDSVDEQYQTTAIGLADACYNNLASTIALLYAGALADAMGIKFMLLVSLALAAVPAAIMAGVTLRARKSTPPGAAPQ